MPRGRPRGGGMGGRGRGGRPGRPRKDGTQGTSLSPAPEMPLQPLAPLEEDVWVQCDACQKWRRLPPDTQLKDDVPWYCSQNYDPAFRSCDIPEENYDALNQVVVASTDPYYADMLPKEAQALQQDLMAKASQLQNQAKDEAQAEQKRRKQAAEKSATVYATLKDELQALVQACQQIIDNGGSWILPASTSQSSQPTTQQSEQQVVQEQQQKEDYGTGVPQWVWSGLQQFAPKPAEVAAQADEVLSSLECFAPGAQESATAAAAAAGIKVEADTGPSDQLLGGGPSTSTPAAIPILNTAPSTSLPHQHPSQQDTSQQGQQRQQQQRQRQLQQIQAARVHARVALLAAASIALPAAAAAQANPDALELPSTSTASKSGKGRKQQEQPSRGRGSSVGWGMQPGPSPASPATPGMFPGSFPGTSSDMFGLQGMFQSPPFPMPTPNMLGDPSQAGPNPFVGLFGALQSQAPAGPHAQQQQQQQQQQDPQLFPPALAALMAGFPPMPSQPTPGTSQPAGPTPSSALPQATPAQQQTPNASDPWAQLAQMWTQQPPQQQQQQQQQQGPGASQPLPPLMPGNFMSFMNSMQ